MFPDYPLTESDRERAYIEMSGRRGLGVRADDLIDTLLSRAREEVEKRNPDFEPARLDDTASKIAVGALRYYMLRFTKNRVVAFDLDAALAFEGETGPYLQYSVVRARNILGKVVERHGQETVSAERLAREIDLEAVPEADRSAHWELAGMLERTPSVVRQAADGLELAVVAKHAYVLAQSFNSFYHRWPVAQEQDSGVRAVRIALVRLYHDDMVDLLGLMGIEVPDRM
jgi:arginyl-tRNA synthetase